MPNRADQSVKTRPRDRNKAIKGYLLAAGSAMAGIGALAVMFVGGASATALAFSVLTILIFLQISFLASTQNQAEEPKDTALERAEQTPSQIDTKGLPILVLSVSSLGRVRSVWGQDAYLPGLKTGIVLDSILSPTAQELDFSPGRSTRAIERYQTESGQWVVISPKSEPGLDARDSVLERTNFFAGLGHDLKSPLNAVIGFSEIMESEIRGPMPEAYREYPGLIKESGETLLRLVEDILGYARSEAGTYELDIAPMDIAASGQSVMRQAMAMADKADVRLKMQGEREVLARSDASAVRRVWDNLVSNAIKYSSPGDTVTLRANVNGDMALLSVTDTGAGMDAEDLARIAQPFSQGRNAKGRVGTGLGLALVHRLAELHGGQVKIESALGKGTRVTVSLPAAHPAQKRAAE